MNEPSTPLIRTKLNPPRLSKGLQARPRLLHQLDRGSELPLIVVSAPAGYGKSSLVASWLETRNGASAWLSLDEGDSDLGLFLQYLLATLRRADEQAYASCQGLLEFSETPPVSIVARVLINGLEELEQETVLVLDDYHLIRDSLVHDLLNSLLRHPPQLLHLVIITRADPPLPLTRLRASGRSMEIRAAELEFSEAETTTFLKSFLGHDLESEAISGLHQRTEGWAAGLQLAALTLRDHRDPRILLESLGAEGGQIGEFLVAEVLAGIPPAHRKRLLTMAVPRRFCAGLCEAIFSDSANSSENLEGEAFLDWCLNANLFINSLDDERKWFRFHHLFRELLVYQLEKAVGREEIREIQGRAADWMEDQGYFDEALSYFLAAGNEDSAVDLVKRNRSAQMNLEQWSRLDRWLRRLPPERVDREPELVLQQAWICENRHRYSEMLGRLERAESLLDGRALNIELRGELNAIRSARHYIEGDGKRAESTARCALDTLPEERLSERGFALVVLTFGLQLQNRANEARGVALEALEDRHHHGTVLHTRALIALCFVHAVEGDTDSLLRSADELLVLGREYSLTESVSFARYFLGTAHWDRNDLAAAEAVLTPLANERVSPQVNNHGHSVYLLAKIHSLRGHTEQARSMLESLASGALARHHPELIRLVEFFAADLAFQQGRRVDAILWTERFVPNLAGPWLRSQVPELTWIKVLLASGIEHDRTQGRRALAELNENLATCHHPRLFIEARCLQAIVDQRDGNADSAATVLKEAVDLARPRGIVRPFLDLGPEMAALLAHQDLRVDGTAIVDAVEGIALPDPTRVEPAFRHARSSHPDALTDRELDVLHLLAERLSNKEIGAKLFISSATVKRHTVNIYQKLQVHHRREAVLKAREVGILGMD